MRPETITASILNDTIRGLSSDQKYLLSKYFYDDEGSEIFRDIMNMPEYYLTNCEFDIFRENRELIIDEFTKDYQAFDLIELGSGDGLKTKILLTSLDNRGTEFRYIPVDISEEANRGLVADLSSEFPSMKVHPVTGDFFSLYSHREFVKGRRKVIMFLGSNIGNLNDAETDNFLGMLSQLCNEKDKMMIGFDLKKSPDIILKAYDDPHGHTSRFNLNLLTRLNRELGANFDPESFSHHTMYNPATGEVRSYLISETEQSVVLEETGHVFHFCKWEPIFMERSRKYDIETIEALANSHGFRVLRNLTDNSQWFLDSVWEKK